MNPLIKRLVNLFETIIYWLSAILVPIVPLVLLVGILVTTDFIAGIAAAKKKGGWTAVKSSRMFDTPLKFLVYAMLLATSSAIEIIYLKQTQFASVPVAGPILGLIIMIELKSLDEKNKKLFGYSLFGALVTIIKKFIKHSDDESKS